MRSSYYLTGLALLVIRLGYSQQRPDTAQLRQQLPEVAVRAHGTVRTLTPPGEHRGLHTVFGRELAPLAGAAVWHGPPNPDRLYVVRAVRLRLGSRLPEGIADVPKQRRNFSEGGLRIWLSPGTMSTGPAEDQNLLAEPLLLTPSEEKNQEGWRRFDVSGQRVVLPAQGCFVVATGTTGAKETFVRHRTLVRPLTRQQPPEDFDFRQHGKRPGKGTQVFRYVELRQADGTSRLAATHSFPTLAYRAVSTSDACFSWVRVRTAEHTQAWRTVVSQQALLRQHTTHGKASDYNYELELEVEEL